MRRQEGRAQFSDQFFGGVAFGAKPAGQVAIEPRFGPGPMNLFMSENRIETFRLSEVLERRHRNAVAGRVEECSIATEPDVSRQAVEEIFGRADAQAVIKGSDDLWLVAVDLIGIESPECTGKGSALLGAVIILSRLCGWKADGLPKEDDGGTFTLAHLSAMV